MKRLRIEEIGNIQLSYRNLEVFMNNDPDLFLFTGITEERKLFFDFPLSKQGITLNLEELEHILSTAKAFLPQALKDEDDFLNATDSS